MGMDALGNKLEQSGGWPAKLYRHVGWIIGTLLLFIATAPARAAVESVPPIKLWCNPYYVDGYISDPKKGCVYPIDLAAAQAGADFYTNFYLGSPILLAMFISSCDGNGLCKFYITDAGSVVIRDMVHIQHVYPACPVPSVNPATLYRYNGRTHMCERTIQENLITLSGDTTTEPWHKKHDKDHLKANLPFKAVVKDQNGQPQANFDVTITTDVTQFSGGHVHTNNRPKGKLVAGAAANTSTKDGKVEIKGRTDGNGVFEFTFGAEEASGTHTLTAICDSGCQAPATATVKVEIPDLMLLGADPKNFELRGDKPWHPDNHYFSATALFKIVDFASAYADKKNFGVPLKINDSSLEKGGVLDIGQDWTYEFKGHAGHRVGVVVDINNYTERNKLFERLAAKLDIYADWHSKGTAPHYHLWLLGRDQ